MQRNMNVPGENFRTIWQHPDDPDVVRIIDQRQLPHRYVVSDLTTHLDGVRAIRDMLVRGAPLIGATAAWSVYLAAREAERAGGGRQARLDFILEAAETLNATRPTAVNLRRAIERMLSLVHNADDADSLVERLRREAAAICEEDVAILRAIGEPVNILTHCNAGSLAAINWGTATAPMYIAHERGIPIHVWVDETRPRNQGSQLTAWELARSGIAHTVIVDNAGGRLMQHGQVDLCITGTDRTASFFFKTTLRIHYADDAGHDAFVGRALGGEVAGERIEDLR